MKILQVVNAFYPAFAYGGPVRVAYELSRRLVQRGHDVTVFTTDTVNANTRQKAKYLEIDGVKVFYFRNISNTLAWRRYFFPPTMIFQLKTQIKTFDIIHIHGTRYFSSILVHHYAKKYGIPYVLQPHGSLPRTIEKQVLKKLYDWVWGYKILKDASKVIAVSETEVGHCTKLGVSKDRIEIIPNGINLTEYTNLPERGSFRRKYSIRDEEKIVLYVGRLNKTKNIDLLIKAFADLSNELDNIRLVLVGPDDRYISELEKNIQSLKLNDKILFTGFVSNDEKIAAYIDADIFVNPRADEIFGLVFLEANACGTPVVCSKGCGIANIIDGKTGFAVHNTKNQLQDAMFEILSNERLRRRFGEQGKRLSLIHI